MHSLSSKRDFLPEMLLNLLLHFLRLFQYYKHLCSAQCKIKYQAPLPIFNAHLCIRLVTLYSHPANQFFTRLLKSCTVDIEISHLNFLKESKKSFQPHPHCDKIIFCSIEYCDNFHLIKCLHHVPCTMIHEWEMFMFMSKCRVYARIIYLHMKFFTPCTIKYVFEGFAFSA